jgi:hypothetical protein
MNQDKSLSWVFDYAATIESIAMITLSSAVIIGYITQQLTLNIIALTLLIGLGSAFAIATSGAGAMFGAWLQKYFWIPDSVMAVLIFIPAGLLVAALMSGHPSLHYYRVLTALVGCSLLYPMSKDIHKLWRYRKSYAATVVELKKSVPALALVCIVAFMGFTSVNLGVRFYRYQQRLQIEQNMLTSDRFGKLTNNPITMWAVEIDHDMGGGDCSITGIYVGDNREYFYVDKVRELWVNGAILDRVHRLCYAYRPHSVGGMYFPGRIGCIYGNPRCIPWQVVLRREDGHAVIETVP